MARPIYYGQSRKLDQRQLAGVIAHPLAGTVRAYAIEWKDATPMHIRSRIVSSLNHFLFSTKEDVYRIGTILRRGCGIRFGETLLKQKTDDIDSLAETMLRRLEQAKP